tara:strand:- start:875 stop:1543 length:669 start_codon:yes stop_codon:yes gene_type:complete
LKLFSNLKKTQVGYTFTNDTKIRGITKPPKLINSPNFKCPSISSTNNRILAIYPKLSAKFTINIDEHAHFDYVINKKHHKSTQKMHDLLLESCILEQVNGKYHFQLVGDICIVTDDKELELLTVVAPNIKTKDCTFINGAFYPYAWLRPLNSAWQVNNGSQITFDRNTPYMYLIFNKPIELNYVENNNIKNYLKETYDIVNYGLNIKELFKNTISRRPKKLL